MSVNQAFSPSHRRILTGLTFEQPLGLRKENLDHHQISEAMGYHYQTHLDLDDYYGYYDHLRHLEALLLLPLPSLLQRQMMSEKIDLPPSWLLDEKDARIHLDHNRLFEQSASTNVKEE